MLRGQLNIRYKILSEKRPSSHENDTHTPTFSETKQKHLMATTSILDHRAFLGEKLHIDFGISAPGDDPAVVVVVAASQFDEGSARLAALLQEEAPAARCDGRWADAVVQLVAFDRVDHSATDISEDEAQC